MSQMNNNNNRININSQDLSPSKSDKKNEQEGLKSTNRDSS